MLQVHSVWLGLLLFTFPAVPTTASRPSLLKSSALANPATFECGKPNGPCGNSIPANVTCEKGPGWCQPGHYCGNRNISHIWITGAELCRPVPKDCGKVGKPCCPSNADAPHGKDTPYEQRLPFCRDGSSCFFDTGAVPDAGTFLGGLGSVGCVAWPDNCAKSAGSCCGALGPHEGYNPQTKSYVKCRGGDMFCNYGDAKAPKFPGSELMAIGICYENKPDCGVIGKTCCIRESAWSSGHIYANGTCIDPLEGPYAPYKLCVASN